MNHQCGFYVENEPYGRLFGGLERFFEQMLLFDHVAFDAIEHQSIARVLPLNLRLQIALNRLVKPTSSLLSCEGGRDVKPLLRA